MLKVGIIGLGFVGNAIKNGFSVDTKIFSVDPKLNTNVEDLVAFSPDLIFVCLPTPMRKNGFQDNSIIELVLGQLNDLLPDVICVIKSTVLPNFLLEICKTREKLVYNPEFLREAHADYDFENSQFVILGGEKEDCEYVKKCYIKNSICKSNDFHFTDLASASLIKYSINAFLATKVLFFNELYDIFKLSNSDSDWNHFITVVSKDARIGKSHMQVPGFDGKRGFGGACFPKDTAALYKYSEQLNKTMEVLKSVIKKNNLYRLKYDDLDDREKEQKVNFDFL
jgi:nucleotide sugar dehydrogenase